MASLLAYAGNDNRPPAISAAKIDFAGVDIQHDGRGDCGTRLSSTPSRVGSASHELWQVDPTWFSVRRDAYAIADTDPAMALLAVTAVLEHDRLEDAIAHRIAQLLASPVVSGEAIRCAFEDACADDASIGEAMRHDMAAVFERDPACNRLIEPLLYFKGFHAIQTHRLAHWLWRKGRKDFALWLQSRSSEVFQTDINPAARIGKGIFLDHATGVVIGGTAVVDDEVSILHDVTLGGTGKESGDRHPKIGRGVLIGAGAKILGSIVVGEGAKVAAGSVVLRRVPANATVAGVPAQVIGSAGSTAPASTMDQTLGPEGDRQAAILVGAESGAR